MLDAISGASSAKGSRNVTYVQGERIGPAPAGGALDAVLMVDAYHEFENPSRCCATSARR